MDLQRTAVSPRNTPTELLKRLQGPQLHKAHIPGLLLRDQHVPQQPHGATLSLFVTCRTDFFHKCHTTVLQLQVVTKATPGTTARSTSPRSVATKPTRPAATSRTTKSLPSSKATIPVTRLTTSANPGKTPGVTSSAIPRTYPTKGIFSRLQIPCCMAHSTPISLVCAPHCQTSCTAVCPPACCVAAPAQYPGVYSSPVLPLQPVYTNQCPSPCSSSCAPRCSPKCRCNAVIY
ncbi:uncharacterized protein LOC144638991 [Oculina patagonica]